MLFYFLPMKRPVADRFHARAVHVTRMSEFTVVEWSDEYTPQLLELTQSTLGTGGAVAKTEAFWQWKHHDNPFGRSYGILALDGSAEQIAALRILLRWQFMSPSGETLRAARAVDTATHPQYQRQGLFSQLTKQAIADLQEDGTRLIFNTPNVKSLPGYLKMGWALVDRRPIYLRPLRPARMLRRRLRPVPRQITDNPKAYFADNAIEPWHTFIGHYGAEVWNLLRAWECQRDACGWRTRRSEAYYSWRYGEHPNVTYYVHALKHLDADGAPLKGLAILRPNMRFGWQEVVLCDMALAEPSADLGRQLICSLVRNLRADYAVAHFAPGSVEYQSIRKTGFLRAAGQGMRFTVRPLEAGLEHVSRPDSWDLSLGDLEVF